MNSREKFQSVMAFEPSAVVPKTEFAYWAGAIRNWFEEGLPVVQEIDQDIQDSEPIRGSISIDKSAEKLSDKNVSVFFSLDSYLEKFPFDFSPMLEKETISENDEYRLYKDNFGITKKTYKKKASIPLVIDYPIKNRKDLDVYLERYDFDFQKRLPGNFDEMIHSLKNRDYPIRLGGNPFGFSFLGRHLMGEVNFMISLYDDPGLVKELNGFYLKLAMNYFSMILDKVEVDCAFILEDVAYRGGSFISEEMFREFMMPYYLEYIDFLKQYGVKNIVVDCDGLIDELVPLWVEAGITGIFPIEAVNDLVGIRRTYPGLVLLGGFDKRVLFAGSTKKEIDKELAKTESVLKTGGYVPHIDHAVSQDVTWENFRYYRSSLNYLIDSMIV